MDTKGFLKCVFSKPNDSDILEILKISLVEHLTMGKSLDDILKLWLNKAGIPSPKMQILRQLRCTNSD